MSADKNRRVCIVTSELYPFTAGGIGRLTHNIIRDTLQRKAPVELHLLVPCWSELDERTVVATFGGAIGFHKAPSLDSPEHTRRWGTAYPPRWAFTDTTNHADSLELMLELKHLEQTGLHFDVVEFPDYLGWGFCTLQERHLGAAFASTEVAIRLHSTEGLIQTVENQAVTFKGLGTMELERRALEEADLIVGHLETVVDENQKFYGFDAAWRSKVTVEFPPIGEIAEPVTPTDLSTTPDLLFVTKVQQFKRPDLFVRGAAAYMSLHPEFQGRAIFACHVVSEEYAQSIRALVPPAFAKRFAFIGTQARVELMRRAIVVIPSDYESLNLTAYEASDLGATIVLNQKCPAFGDGTPFIDGENCYKFDGSVEDLSEAIGRAVHGRTLKRVARKAATPYYERQRSSAWHPRPSAVGSGRVSVLITNYNLAAYLPTALESIAASTYQNFEIVIVDDASTSPLDAEVLGALEREKGDLPIKVIRNVVNRGLPASRNEGLRHCTGDYVLPLDADDRIAPRFIEVAVRALSGSPQHSVVVPTTGYFLTDDAVERREFIDFACFIGNAPTLGLVANRFSTATALMRRSLFDRFQYDERLDSYEDWSLYLRMAHAGVRFLVTNEIGFHYRRRERSMIRGIDPGRHQRLLSRLYATLPTPLSPALQLRYLPLLLEPGRAPPTAAAAVKEEKRPLRYRFADQANAMVKRTPIHRRIKETLRPPGSSDDRPLRYEVADRLQALAEQLAPIGAWFGRARR